MTVAEGADFDLSRFFESERALFAITGDDGRFRMVNPAFERLLGRSAEDLCSRSMLELIHPEDIVATLEGLATLVAAGDEVRFENRFEHADGSHRSLTWFARRATGDGVHYAIAHDVSERRRLEARLAVAEQRLELTTVLACSGSWDWDLSTGDLELDTRACSLLGLEDTTGRLEDLLGVVSDDDRPGFTASARNALDHGGLDLELRLVHGRGSGAVGLRGRSTARDRRGRTLTASGIVWSTSAAQDLERQLLDLVTKDPLTGARNRRAFDQALRAEWRRSRRTGTELAIALFDLDDFKRINDTRGHLAGDEALVATARILEASVRADVDLVARWGGEEFIALLPGADLAAALAVAERAVAAIREFGFTMTAGVAAGFGQVGVDAHELVQRADDALYAGKAAGKDRVVRG